MGAYCSLKYQMQCDIVTESRKWLADANISGRRPEPRSFHAATVVGNRMVILGGRGRENQHFDAIHVFDSCKNQSSHLM